MLGDDFGIVSRETGKQHPEDKAVGRLAVELAKSTPHSKQQQYRYQISLTHTQTQKCSFLPKHMEGSSGNGATFTF